MRKYRVTHDCYSLIFKIAVLGLGMQSTCRFCENEQELAYKPASLLLNRKTSESPTYEVKYTRLLSSTCSDKVVSLLCACYMFLPLAN